MPFFARTPSAPGFQPASSSSLIALSILNSHFVFFETNLLRSVDEVGGIDAGAAVDVLVHRGAIDQQVERLPHRRIGQERMLRLEAGALAVDLGPRIGVVELDVLDVAAGHDLGVALAARLRAA